MMKTRLLTTFGVAALALAACNRPVDNTNGNTTNANGPSRYDNPPAPVRTGVTHTTSAEQQAQAERSYAADRADFMRTREDYRHDRAKDLTDLDEKIAKLEAKSKTATGKTKAEIDAALPDLRLKRDAFKRDFERIGDATEAGWDETKARLDHEWDEVSTSLKHAPTVW